MAAMTQGQLLVVHFWMCSTAELRNLMAWIEVFPGFWLLKTCVLEQAELTGELEIQSALKSG